MSIDRHQNKESGIPDSSPFHKKYVAIRKKVFGSTPFSKGVAGCRAEPGAKTQSDHFKEDQPFFRL